MTRRRYGRTMGIAVAVALLVGASACGDDDGDEAADTSATSTTAEATTTTLGVTTVEVVARDYTFDGVPETVAAGSTISITTEDGGEPHEFVAARLPDGETRSVDELIALPEAEFGALFADEEGTLVTIALPGTTDTPGPVVGDGTLTLPGRYLYLCTFPQGTTVEDVQNATGPLQGEDPHYTLGMFGELTVEEVGSGG